MFERLKTHLPFGAQIMSLAMFGASLGCGAACAAEYSSLSQMRTDNSIAQNQGDQYLQGYEQGRLNNEVSSVDFLGGSALFLSAVGAVTVMTSYRRRNKNNDQNLATITVLKTRDQKSS